MEKLTPLGACVEAAVLLHKERRQLRTRNVFYTKFSCAGGMV